MHMTTHRRLIGAALGFALFVAACGGSSAASPTASPAAAATQAPAASQAAVSQAPADTAAPSDTSAPAASMPEISLTPGGAGDLEAMLPSTIGSVTFQKTSVDGSQIAGAGTPLDTSKMDPLLSKYGKSIADVRLAIATGTGGATTGMPEMVYAIQLKGVPASEWVQSLDTSGSKGDQMTVGGKQVTGTSQAGFTTVFYTKDDITFMVIAPDKDAQAIVAALP
jgi:hypothetical protein